MLGGVCLSVLFSFKFILNTNPLINVLKFQNPILLSSTTKNKSCTMENNRKQYKYIDNIATYIFINSHLT